MVHGEDRDLVKPPPFGYAVASSVTEAVDHLVRADGTARVLAGGQSLLPLLRARSVRPSLLVDITRIEDLRAIAESNGTVHIGAVVTHGAVERWAGLRSAEAVAEAMRCVGHAAVRSLGTVGGSLAFADPAAEWCALALALDATCEVTGPDGTRTLPVERLATGPFTTSLGPAEVITGVRLRMPGPDSGSAFIEVASGAGGPAVVAVAVVLDLLPDGVVGDARIAVAGAGPTAVRATAAERLVSGEPVTPAALHAAAAAVLDGASVMSGGVTSAALRARSGPVAAEEALKVAWQRAMQRSQPEARP